MPNVIRLGDPIEKGGNVIASAAPFCTIDGIPVALVGDACSCHDDCRIAEGDAVHTVNGTPVAYHGHKTTCGRALISTISTYTKK